LSQGFLRAYSSSKPVDDELMVDDAAWAAERVARHLGDLRGALVALRERHGALVTLAETCPQTLCHLDVWPANIVRRRNGTFALLDWAFSGSGALGEDIANLVPDSIFDLLIPAACIDELASRTEAAYIDGVHDAGWQGDERWIRLGVRTPAAKYHWLAERLLRDAAEPERVVYGGRVADADEVYAARAAGLRVLCRWADEAFALAHDLGIATSPGHDS
jgi:hypothetical protein